MTAVTSENDPDPVGAAQYRILDRAVAGQAAIRQKHESDWKEFWSKSMVDLPEKYLENYWYLNLYYASSSSRGPLRPFFQRPLRLEPGFLSLELYFHWNEQVGLPLHAANHASWPPHTFATARPAPYAMDTQ